MTRKASPLYPLVTFQNLCSFSCFVCQHPHRCLGCLLLCFHCNSYHCTCLENQSHSLSGYHDQIKSLSKTAQVSCILWCTLYIVVYTPQSQVATAVRPTLTLATLASAAVAGRLHSRAGLFCA